MDYFVLKDDRVKNTVTISKFCSEQERDEYVNNNTECRLFSDRNLFIKAMMSLIFFSAPVHIEGLCPEYIEGIRKAPDRDTDFEEAFSDFADEFFKAHGLG